MRRRNRRLRSKQHRAIATGDSGTVVDVVNLTPHPVVLVGEGEPITIPGSNPKRLAPAYEYREDIDTNFGPVPLFDQLALHAVELPAERSGTLLVVSLLVALLHRDREDLVVPADLVRDRQGAVIGCKGLARVGAILPL